LATTNFERGLATTHTDTTDNQESTRTRARARPEGAGMAQPVKITTKPRTKFGSSSAIKLRRAGEIPANIYGHKQANEFVTVPAEEFYKIFRQGAKLFELKLGDKTETVRIKELQYDHLGREILHIDFQRTAVDERIQTRVPVELRGIAPGTSQGGVVDQPLHTLEIETLASAVPNSIRVDISGLQLNQAIHVKELRLPEGVRALDDEDLVVVQVKLPASRRPRSEAAEAEPEVIARGKVEKPEGEE
jgi:large subunit ribosomal protein L25